MVKLLAVCVCFLAFSQNWREAWGQAVCSIQRPESTVTQDTKNGAGQTAREDVLNNLIEERLSLMSDVARAKWNSKSAIEDPVREQQVLADVGVKAQGYGVPAEWAEHFFRLQIEAAKEIQYCLFAQWKAQRKGSFQSVPDLRQSIRPRLDALTGEMLEDIAKEWPHLKGRRLSNDESCRAFGDSDAVCLALLPLRDGSIDSY